MVWLYILGALGVLSGVLLLLDKFLSEQTKAEIEHVHLLIWNRLDDWKRRSISDWLFNRRTRVWFAFIAMAASLCFMVWDVQGDHGISGWLAGLIYLSAALFGALLGWVLLIYTLRRGVASSVYRALFLFIVMAILAFHVGYNFLVVWDDVDLFEYYQREGVKAFTGVAYAVSFHALWTAAMFWWAAFIPLIAVLSAQGLLIGAEFIFRRVCEAKDGVINAWSKIFKGLSQIFKPLG